MKNKKNLFFIIMFACVLLIGSTIAYYTSYDTFTNLFKAPSYVIATQETFESPDKWLPGDTTPKMVIATNNGGIDAAVRVKLTPSWEDSEGNSLPLTDTNNVPAAIIDFNENLYRKWEYKDGWYYYRKSLAPGQSTTTLMESVTFNPDFEIEGTTECTTNEVTHKKSCVTTLSGYSGGKYTLVIEIETCQYDKYPEIWTPDVEIDPITPDEGMLMRHDSTSSKTFGKSIARSNFESITTVDSKVVPADAIDSWDASAEQNGSVMAWYTDSDNNGKYELFLGQNGGVMANIYCDYTFYYFRNVNSIDLTNFDTTGVINMDFMFSNTTVNITGLDDLDTSSVRSLMRTFEATKAPSTSFVLDVDSWDTSKVEIMRDTFNAAKTYDASAISNWDTKNVTTMRQMFVLSYVRLGDLSGWDTSKVTDMSYMFMDYGGSGFSLTGLNSWNTSKVTTMKKMFENSGLGVTNYYLDLSGWDTSNVETMENMFADTADTETTTSFTIVGLDNWNVSKVKNMDHMFHAAGLYSSSVNIGDLSNWDTRSLESLYYTFYGLGMHASSIDIGDLDNWNVSKVTNMEGTFYQFGLYATSVNIGDLSGWNPKNVTTMKDMFHSMGRDSTSWNIGNLNNWNVSKVQDFSNMFLEAAYGATSQVTMNLSGWQALSATTMQGMFYSFGYSSPTVSLNLSNWNAPLVSNMKNMFAQSGYNSSTSYSLIFTNLVNSAQNDMTSMFANMGYQASNFTLDVDSWNISNVTNMSRMFNYTGYNATNFSLTGVEDFNTTNVLDMQYMFANCGYYAPTFLIDLSSWNTKNVTTMASMFLNAGYKASTWGIGDLSGWNTGHVTTMASMFSYAGYDATTWNSIGTLKVFANVIKTIFDHCKNASATLNIYNNPSSYTMAFDNASTVTGALINVNYSSTTTNIDNIIATKSSNSNVIKGSLLS